MGVLKSTLITMVGLLFFQPVEALAFHSGQESECDGCHGPFQQTADPFGLSSPFPEPAGGPKYMLRGSDPSSTCLRCHAGKVKVFSADGSAYSPGGDFFWLTRTYNDGDGRSAGYNHGHSVVSRDFRLGRDPVRAVAPSDGSVSYESGWLGCTSCHDPHARVRVGAASGADEGNFRLLGGIGYQGGSLAAGIGFSHPAPVARAYPAQGDRLAPETDENHVAYGSGMSEWCSNCHSGMAGSGQHRHPAGEEAKLGALALLYDAYIASGNMEGTHATGYDFLVPFEQGTDDPALLSTSSTQGPTAGSNVMCLTCHRAHASPFPSAGRWDLASDLLSESAVLSSPEARHAYYGEDISLRYGSYQRSLCNKCHARD